MENQVTEVEQVTPDKFGIEPAKATELMGTLPVVKQERESLIAEFNEVVVMNIDDKATSKKAGDLRKRIAKNRTQGIMEWHKRAKEFFLRGGQFVDAIKRVEVSINEKMEEVLEQIEKHQENLEKQRKEALRAERLTEIQKYNGSEPIGLSDFTEEQFSTYMNGVRYQFEQVEKARIEAEEKQRKDNLHNERKMRLARYADFIDGFDSLYFGDIDEKDFVEVGMEAKAKKEVHEAEQERLRMQAEADRKARDEAEKKALEAKEKADAEARKVQAEAEAKLKEAKDKADAEARKAKAAADAKLKEEQDARDKAEAEAKRLKDAEDARIKAEQDEIARKQREADELASKGDAEKIQAWIESFQLPSAPSGKYTKKGEAKITEIATKFQAFKDWANTLNNK